MKKTRLLLALLAIALFSSINLQAQCDSSNYQEDLCDTIFAEVEMPQATLNRSILPGDVYYLHSSAAAHPWNQTTNPTAMDAVFGSGNWTQEFFETAVPATLFSEDTSLIYIDGSDDGAPVLNTFITANGAAMETWVNNGGLLFFNAASQGPDVPLFGDIVLEYDNSTPNVDASNATHPAFLGPLTTSTSFSGNNFAHNRVVGSGLTNILEKSTDAAFIVLAEGNFGEGYVLAGGMTTTNWHSPNPDATNFRTNLLHMMANSPDITDCYADETIDVIEGETYTLPDYVANGDVTALNATVINQDPPAGTEIDSDMGSQTVTFTAVNESIIEDVCSFVLTVEEILGTNEVEVSTFSMFPNPTATSFKIEGNFTVERVEIYNLLGQKVTSETTNQVDVSSLNTGIYTVTVTDIEGNQASKRLLKK